MQGFLCIGIPKLARSSDDNLSIHISIIVRIMPFELCSFLLNMCIMFIKLISCLCYLHGSLNVDKMLFLYYTCIMLFMY